MADKEKEKQKVDADQFHFLEEDDEFEEFPSEGTFFLFIFVYEDNDKRFFKIVIDWVDAGDEDGLLSVWEDNWDDDNLDNLDDFNEQLKQQMKK